MNQGSSPDLARLLLIVVCALVGGIGTVGAQTVGDFYVVDFSDSLRRLDPMTLATLETTTITGLQPGNDIVGCAFDSATCDFMVVGKISGAMPTVLYTLDEQTGVATLIDTITLGGAGYAISDISFAPDGTLWGISGVTNGNQIVTIDTMTAEVTVIGNSGMAGGGNGLTWGPGGVLFSADEDNFYTIDPATGVATVLSTAPASTIGTLSWDGVSATFTSLDAAFAGEVNIVTTSGVATPVGTVQPIPLSCGLVRPCGSDPEFVRGDVDTGGSVNIADAIALLAGLFSSGPIDCERAADTNSDGGLNISDAVFLLGFLFSSGPSPLAPFPNCGAVPGVLSCSSFAACP